MSAQSILGVIGTATIEVAEVEKLMAERDRARELAANLEQLLSEGRRLLELAVTQSPSHAFEQQVGRDIVQFLRETA